MLPWVLLLIPPYYVCLCLLLDWMVMGQTQGPSHLCHHSLVSLHIALSLSLLLSSSLSELYKGGTEVEASIVCCVVTVDVFFLACVFGRGCLCTRLEWRLSIWKCFCVLECWDNLSDLLLTWLHHSPFCNYDNVSIYYSKSFTTFCLQSQRVLFLLRFVYSIFTSKKWKGVFFSVILATSPNSPSLSSLSWAILSVSSPPGKGTGSAICYRSDKSIICHISDVIHEVMWGITAWLMTNADVSTYCGVPVDTEKIAPRPTCVMMGGRWLRCWDVSTSAA